MAKLKQEKTHTMFNPSIKGIKEESKYADAHFEKVGSFFRDMEMRIESNRYAIGSICKSIWENEKNLKILVKHIESNMKSIKLILEHLQSLEENPKKNEKEKTKKNKKE